MKINGTIVLYNNDEILLKKAIHSFLNTNLDVRLYLVDNSVTNYLKYLETIDDRIEYIFNNNNLGFGRAHNIVIKKSIEENNEYHLVLNPDVYFNTGVIEELLSYMENNLDIANTMPKVYYPDGTIQYLCKLLPTPIELIVRRFIPFNSISKKINKKYELQNFGYEKKMNIPNLSGCFMFLRTKHLKDIGMFDENIFMYMEDIDLNRRLHVKYKTMFYPYVSIVHIHAKDSYKRKRLLFEHIKSTIYYFNKWGWFFDKERMSFNKKVLNLLKD